MTESGGKENRQRIIFSALMLLMIFVLTIVVLVRIKSKTEDHAYLELKEEARDADVRISTLMEDTFNALNSMSAVVLSHDQKEESPEVAQTLSNLHVGKLAMGVRLYYPDGSALTEKGIIDDVSQYVDYEETIKKMKNNRYISCCKTDYLNSDKEILEMFAPVRKGNDIIVIISAVLNTDQLPDFMMSSSFEGQSELMLIDTRDGKAFVDTFHKQTSNFTDFSDRTDKKGKSIKPFVDSVLACEESYTTLKSQSTGKTLYLYAVPSQIEGWVSMIFVEEDLAFAESISVGTVLFQLAGVEALLFLVYIIWMIRSSRKQIIDESKKLVSQMMGYDGLFLINLNEDTRKTIYNHCVMGDNYGDEEKYSEAFTRYIAEYVTESDRDEMLKYTSLKYLKEFFRNEKEFAIQYRDTSIGIQRFYEMRLVKVSNTEMLQSFKEQDREIVDKLLFNRMKEDYFSFMGLDLDSGLIRVLKKSPWYRMGEENDILSYTPTILSFAEVYEGETKNFFKKMSDPKYVKKRLEKEDKISFTYKSQLVEGTKWVNAVCLVVSRNRNGQPSLCALGFSLLDEDASKIQEYQSQLTDDMQMIGGLASEYYTLYFYNINEGNFKVYSLDGQRYPELKQIVSKDKSPISMLQEFGNSDLVHPDDRKQFEELSVDFIKNKLAHSKKYTVRFRRKYFGEYLWLEMDTIKYEDIDVEPNAIAIGFAIRDKDIREEQRRKQELENARLAADAANVSKTNFLFNMSHDIRTPLNAITGFTAMAQKNVEDIEKTKEYLEKIDIAGQQLVTLINQVLEMARIESGKIDFDEKPVNIYDKYNGLVTILAEQTRANGQEFYYSLEDVQHENVLADEARMGSITLNIVGNAMKYTPQGGRIDFALKEVEPRKEGYATFVLTVSDTGIGMSKEYLEKLFEPFSREKTSTVSKIQGTGLGMSIVKSIVDLLGGKIEVQSEIGKGTRFDITIDFKIADEIMEEEQSEYDTGKVTFEGRRVLVVEDNEMNREIVKYILIDKGFIVEEAEDGDVAVEMLKAVADREDYYYYDVVLMDVQMPRMNGFEATKAIRDIPVPEGIRLPIIAMTANAFEEDRKHAFDAGMDEHVAKPIDIHVLLHTIAKFLK